MYTSIRAELQKARRRHDLIVCLLVPVMALLGASPLRRPVLTSWHPLIVPCFTACPSSIPF